MARFDLRNFNNEGSRLVVTVESYYSLDPEILGSSHIYPKALLHKDAHYFSCGEGWVKTYPMLTP